MLRKSPLTLALSRGGEREYEWVITDFHAHGRAAGAWGIARERSDRSNFTKNAIAALPSSGLRAGLSVARNDHVRVLEAP